MTSVADRTSRRTPFAGATSPRPIDYNVSMKTIPVTAWTTSAEAGRTARPRKHPIGMTTS